MKEKYYEDSGSVGKISLPDLEPGPSPDFSTDFLVKPSPSIGETVLNYDSSCGQRLSELTVNGDVKFNGNVHLKPVLPPQVYHTAIRVYVEEYYGVGIFYPTFYLGSNEVIINQSANTIKIDEFSYKTIVTYTIGVPCVAYDKAIENEIDLATNCLKADLKTRECEIEELRAHLKKIQSDLKVAEMVRG